jgi:hypothetical protein
VGSIKDNQAFRRENGVGTEPSVTTRLPGEARGSMTVDHKSPSLFCCFRKALGSETSDPQAATSPAPESLATVARHDNGGSAGETDYKAGYQCVGAQERNNGRSRGGRTGGAMKNANPEQIQRVKEGQQRCNPLPCVFGPRTPASLFSRHRHPTTLASISCPPLARYYALHFSAHGAARRYASGGIMPAA